MRTPVLYITISAGIIALGMAGYSLLYNHPFSGPERVPEEKPESLSYTAPVYGLSFEYSPSYVLEEQEAGERSKLSLVLVEDTPENRDLLEGRTETPRDGPTSITVAVYPNPDKLPAEDWVQGDTNWALRTTEAAPAGYGSITGVTYSWSGLYEGRSVVVTEGQYAYVFSVTSLTESDAILAEFDQLLKTVRITPESI